MKRTKINKKEAGVGAFLTNGYLEQIFTFLRQIVLGAVDAFAAAPAHPKRDDVTAVNVSPSTEQNLSASFVAEDA